MAPRLSSTSAKNKMCQSTPHAGTRSSARLKHLQPSPTPPAPTSQLAPTKWSCLQQDSNARTDELEGIRPPPTPPAPISQPASTKRKRPQDSEAGAKVDEPKGIHPSPTPEAEADELEGVRPFKQPRERPSPTYKLSEQNLQILNILNGEDMDSTPNTPSRRSTAYSSGVGTERTQHSSSSPNAVYRYENLAEVEIHMHVEPPDYIQAAIDRVISAGVSKERRSELRVIAEELRNDCLENVRARVGEDDFINPLRTALNALGLENLCTRYNSDWTGDLKPVAPQEDFSPNFTSGEPYIPPKSSIANARTHTPAKDSQELSIMPALLPRGSSIKTLTGSPIKNPRPDISIGIRLTALISALSSQGLNNVKARKFLTWLRKQMAWHEPHGRLEPMLILVPAPRASDLTFPFAVVEAKAYSTGKQIFEAENQASVSGACGLKIQLDLDNLVDRGTTASDALPTTSNTEPPNALPTSNTEPPLFFTICTQGPIHELWAHWTIVENGVRIFGSKLLYSCNALLLEQGEGFVVRVNNIGFWGLGPFMRSVVERLGMVAAKATQR